MSCRRLIKMLEQKACKDFTQTIQHTQPYIWFWQCIVYSFRSQHAQRSTDKEQAQNAETVSPCSKSTHHAVMFHADQSFVGFRQGSCVRAGKANSNLDKRNTALPRSLIPRA